MAACRRGPRRPGLRRRSALLALLLLPAGCRDGGEELPRADQLLQDSLGLAPDAVVFRVEVAAVQGRERVQPAEVRVPPGSWVEFATTDRRVHTVAFVLDGVPPEVASFLRETAQVASPPLLDLDARFVVSFEGAPPGRYPFRVEGSGSSASGAVIVEPP